MSQDSRTAAFTTEFGQEFDAERESWLRRRFLWYTGIIGGFNVFATVMAPVALGFTKEQFASSQVTPAIVIVLAVRLAITALFAIAFVRAWRRTLSKGEITSMVTVLIVGHGLTQLVGALLMYTIAPSLIKVTSLGIGSAWLFSVFATHCLACLFVPLTPREAMRPLVPLLVINAVMVLLFNNTSLIDNAIIIAISPVVGLPGAAICWWRHSRFRDRFTQRMIKGRYLEMRRELVDARRIHEALFPAPVRDGALRFDYAYEPMRQIGGDYLHLCFGPADAGQDRPMNLVVIDVTGHGIPAALTVNRLHGELQRVFAENPRTPPGEVLRLLNSYVHLTLAGHSVYVTAFCVRIDPEQETIEYASGGHPPAFLRAVDGTIEQLASTAFVLGACPGEDFRPDPRALRFGPGDTLVAYTDGAIEARDRTGRYFGVGGLQRILATATPPAGGGWPSIVTRAVDQHRFGPIADDTLVVEVRRPIDVGVPKSAPVRSVAGVGA